MNPRAQTSVELLVILGISVIILAGLINFTVQRLNELEKERAVETTQQSVHTLINSINNVFRQGPGTIGQVNLTWPRGVDSSQTTISGRSIKIRIYDTDVYGTAITSIVGSLPLSAGTQTLKLVAFDTNVLMGTSYLTANVSTVYIPMAQDSNASSRVTLTNLSGQNATVTNAISWSHTLVGVSLVPSTGTIYGGKTLALDLNTNAQASALGNYVGQLNVSASFPSSVESLSLPVNAEVFPTSGALLSAAPPSIGLSTFGSDTNSTHLQLCNNGNTPIKTISFHPSSGNPGAWVQGISTISQLDAGSCTNVTVQVVVPNGVGIGGYGGSIAITDFAGANTIIVPLTVNVLGMGSFFGWSWLSASTTPTSIFGHAIQNRGSKPVTIDKITIQKWWACDTSHSYLSGITIDGNSVFSGSAQDGNAVNVTDYNIPSQTTYTNNTLSFDSTINDQNEQFQAIVGFPDATTYTSSVYGVGCPADLNAPARVIDLNAFSGAKAGTILVRWTYPGDDNGSGTPTSAILKYGIEACVGTDPNFTNASAYPLTQMMVGGTSGSLTVPNLSVGQSYHFAVTFKDEADNNGGISNLAQNLPWNRFQYSQNDFNIANFPMTIYPTNEGDITQFDIHNLVVGLGRNRNIVIRVQSDTNNLHSWTAWLNFDTANLRRIAIWYPGDGNTGIPTTPPQYDGNYRQSLSTTISLVDGTLIPSPYHYNGSSVVMPGPNHLYLDIFSGFTDMNMTLNTQNNLQQDCI